jgi:hypothetical protein
MPVVTKHVDSLAAVAVILVGVGVDDAVVGHGLEDVVAKRRNGIYRPAFRGWTKINNPNYWRRTFEIDGVRHRRKVKPRVGTRRRGPVTSSVLRSAAKVLPATGAEPVRHNAAIEAQREP